MNNKKIVWLCPLDLSQFIGKAEKLFINNKVPIILAPWITLLIQEFSNRKEIELHIITEFSTLKKDTSLTRNNIHFHLLSQKMWFFRRGWPYLIKFHSNHFLLKRKVKSIITRIKPDLIHLHGTEHDLSAVFTDLTYTKLISIQGFIFSVYKQKQTKYYFRKLNIENKVLTNSDNFIIRADFMKERILSFNKSAKFFYLGYPVKFLNNFIKSVKTNSTNSIVFAARITKDKGIEDLYRAMALVKKRKPNIILNVIGPVSEEYKKFLSNYAQELTISENINFIGFLDSQDEVHKRILKNQLYVLPTYHDVVPGSIAEAMYLGIPVVSYDIDGVNDFNKGGKRIFLVKKGNVEELAETILYLLNNDKERSKYIDVAKNYVVENLSSKKIVTEMIKIYDKIINV